MPKLSEFNVLTTTGLNNTIIPIIELNSETNKRNKNILISDLRTLIFNATKASAQTLGAIRVGTSLSINNDGILNVAVPIPDQATNDGKVLTTNGSVLSWQDIGSISIPPATTTTLGLVKIDGTSITIDANNVISADFSTLTINELLSPNGDFKLSVDNLGSVTFGSDTEEKLSIDYSLSGIRISNLMSNESIILGNDNNLTIPGTIHQNPQDISGFDETISGTIDLRDVEPQLISSVLYVNPLVNTVVILPLFNGVFGIGKTLTLVNGNSAAILTINDGTTDIFDVLPQSAKQVVSDGFSWKALSSSGGSADTGNFIFNLNDASLPAGNDMTLSTYQSGGNKESKLTLSTSGISSLDVGNNLRIRNGNGTGFERTWTFGSDGSITWPDASVQTTAYTGGGSGGFFRNSVGQTTASIANGATDNITIVGYKSYVLMSITVDNAAWVRIYTDATSRTADSGRLEGTDPLPGSGVIAEVITTGLETILISPGALGFNNEFPVTTNIPVAVTNKSGVTQTITVTLQLLQLES